MGNIQLTEVETIGRWPGYGTPGKTMVGQRVALYFLLLNSPKPIFNSGIGQSRTLLWGLMSVPILSRQLVIVGDGGRWAGEQNSSKKPE